MKTLWFIRHAQSLSNAGLPTDTPHSIGLSELGVQQAERLAAQWETQPQLIVVSPYDRTTATAQPLMKRYPDCPVITMPVHELTFLAPALYAGTTEEMRREPAGQFWDRSDPDYCDGEGAESFRQFYARIDAAVNELLQREEARIAVFCHSYVIKAIVWRLLHPTQEVTNAHMKAFHGFHRSMVVKNAQVFPICVLPDGELALKSPF